MQLADPTTVQAFITADVNSNFLALENGIVADRVRISALEPAKLLSTADLTSLFALNAATYQGQEIYVISCKTNFQARASVWVQQGTAQFLDIATRDTEYAKASGAYLQQGAFSLALTEGIVRQYFLAYNSVTNPDGQTVGWYPTLRVKRTSQVVSVAGVVAGGGVFSAPVQQRAYVQTLLFAIIGTHVGNLAGTAAIGITVGAGGTLVTSGTQIIPIATTRGQYATYAQVTVAAGTGTVTVTGTAALATTTSYAFDGLLYLDVIPT